MAIRDDVATGDNSQTTSQTAKYDKSSYKVENHQYPEDLGSSTGSSGTKYGGHRVVFYINVQGSGSIARNQPALTMSLPPSKFARVSGSTEQEAVKEFGRGAIGSITGNNDTLSILSPKKRLVSAISLYVPETLVKSYSVDWGVENSESMMSGSTVAQTILAGQELGKQNRGFVDSLKLIATPSVSQAATKALNGMKYAQKSLGITPGNTKAELLFNAVDFNQFSFDYRFAPKSEKEAANVLSIIRMFRHHMLPEYYDKLNYLYIYPSEFEVSYWTGTDENPYLEQHMTAVLRNVTINYNPNGQFMTFDNGMPTHINLTLQFQELAVPTKETSPYDRSGA